MATWQEFHDAVPDLAAKVEARFAANTHHVLGTLRSDGSPRLSGTEVHPRDGELYLGSMWRARKALDLQRDPRCAVHANPSDPTMAGGDAKLDAVAVEVEGVERDAFYAAVGAPPGENHLFRLDIHRVVLTEVDPEADQLTVQVWRPGHEILRMVR
jgi:hypothetical protein